MIFNDKEGIIYTRFSLYLGIHKRLRVEVIYRLRRGLLLGGLSVLRGSLSPRSTSIRLMAIKVSVLLVFFFPSLCMHCRNVAKCLLCLPKIY